jgi:hypothetical protein
MDALVPFLGTGSDSHRPAAQQADQAPGHSFRSGLDALVPDPQRGTPRAVRRCSQVQAVQVVAAVPPAALPALRAARASQEELSSCSNSLWSLLAQLELDKGVQLAPETRQALHKVRFRV